MKTLIFSLLFCAIATLSGTLPATTTLDCSDNPCQNGGKYKKGKCKCPKGYVGENCEIVTCLKLKCEGNSICQTDSLTQAGSCQCKMGYEGTDCNTKSREKYIGKYMSDGERCQVVKPYLAPNDVNPKSGVMEYPPYSCAIIPDPESETNFIIQAFGGFNSPRINVICQPINDNQFIIKHISPIMAKGAISSIENEYYKGSIAKRRNGNWQITIYYKVLFSDSTTQSCYALLNKQ